MSAARIITTTEKFDETGKLVERITEERILEKHECKCEKQKRAEDAAVKAKKTEEAIDLTDNGIRTFAVSKLMGEILVELKRMRAAGVPCPFSW